MKKTRSNSTYARRRHTERRSMERYGIVLNTRKQKEIIGMIHSGKAKLIWKESLSRAHYEVLCEGKVMHIVYSRSCRTLVTVLPAQSQDSHCLESEALDGWIREKITNKIESGDARTIKNVSASVSRIGVVLDNKLLIVFYDTKRKKIINEAEVKMHWERIFGW